MGKTILAFSNEEIQVRLPELNEGKLSIIDFFDGLTPYWKNRDELELDPTYRQPIIYTRLFTVDGDEKNIFLYQRKGGGEKRLDAQFSIGIGGHVDIEDKDITDSNWTTLRNSFYRELKEEIPSLNFYNSNLSFDGLITSEETEVDKVHVGVCMSYQVENLNRLDLQEGVPIGGISQRVLLNLINAQPDLFESWTRQFAEIL